jgi:type IV secretory pathway VirB10-like protein
MPNTIIDKIKELITGGKNSDINKIKKMISGGKNSDEPVKPVEEENTEDGEQRNDTNEESGKRAHGDIGYTGIKKQVPKIAVIGIAVILAVIYLLSKINISGFFPKHHHVSLKKIKIQSKIQNNMHKHKSFLSELQSSPELSKLSAKKPHAKKTVKIPIRPVSAVVNGKAGAKVPSIPAAEIKIPKANTSAMVVISASSKKLALPATAKAANPYAGLIPPQPPPAAPAPAKVNHNKKFLKKMKQATNVTATASVMLHFPKLTLTPGTIIPATLITGINSDLPGEVKAMVNSNVYSHDLKYLLIPDGSFLIGSYSSTLGPFQNRALIAFNLVIFPNGREMELPGFQGYSHRGYSGLNDIVNTHFMEMAKAVGLLTLLQFGMAEAVPPQIGFAAVPSPSQNMEQALSSNVGNIAAQILQRYTSVSPTVIIKPGFTFDIVVVKNILFNHPYED